MDFRLNSWIEKWALDSGVLEGGFDVISAAGASKDLVCKDTRIGNNFLKHIGVSVELHKAKSVVIMHHSDCGAYAKNYKFSSKNEEKETQTKDMIKSKSIIQKKYPDVIVLLFWAEIETISARETNVKFYKL